MNQPPRPADLAQILADFDAWLAATPRLPINREIAKAGRAALVRLIEFEQGRTTSSTHDPSEETVVPHRW